MIRRTLILGALSAVIALAAGHSEKRQYFEFRTYHLSSAAELPKVDGYLEKALLPALKRQGIELLGAFSEKTPEGNPKVYVLIPFDSIEQFSTMQGKLDNDSAYQSAGADYFNTPQKEPRYSRIDSELMLSFAAFPKPTVPKQAKMDKPRLFELRSYESHSEKMGMLKVEMFNSGEVPAFLDVGIQPVFMGRVIAGPKMPNLTYMTVYDDDAALAKAWEGFGPHPGWQKLKAMDKYKGTVSKIHKVLLLPRPYSAF